MSVTKFQSLSQAARDIVNAKTAYDGSLKMGMSIVDAFEQVTAGKATPIDLEAWNYCEDKRKAAEGRPKAGSLSIKINPLGKHLLDKDGEKRYKDGVALIGKGNLQVSGFGRFPITLYANQWERLLDIADDIRQTIKAAQEGDLAEK